MKNIEIKPISTDELPQVKNWIHNHHYIKRWPTGVRYKLGIYLNNKLVGTLLYGPPLAPTSGTTLFRDKNNNPIMQNNQVLELLRAYTTDEAKSQVNNLGSYVIAKGNEYIRTKGQSKDGKPIRAILSYADPEVAHRGTVYKATNAAYLGPQQPSPVIVITNPKTGKSTDVHPMSIYQAYGSRSLDKLREHPKLQGMKIEKRMTKGKHKYLFPLGKTQRDRDELMSQLTKPLFSYPEPGKEPHEIPNEYKTRQKQLQQKQQQSKPKAPQSKRSVIKRLLMTKIMNPKTHNKILVRTALGYDKSHPARKTADHIVSAIAQKHNINVRSR